MNMNIDLNAIQTAAKFLTEGKLVALPTETVYGLGADARNKQAILSIFQVKKRPATNPLIIHLSHVSAIQAYARDIPETAFFLAQAFWPGPLTLVLPKHPSVLAEVTGGQDSVALRIPNHPVALALLETFGGGIAAPSANLSGGISPTTAQHVYDSLGSSVDFILEGGACQVGIESTIVSLLEDKPIILRQGQISEQAIAKVLGYSCLPSHSTITVETPGSSLKHYAPSKPLFLLDTETLKKDIHRNNANKKISAVLSIRVSQDIQDIPWIQLQNDPNHYAQGLYAALHQLDKSKAECILVELPPDDIAWKAIHDRLQRAAAL